MFVISVKAQNVAAANIRITFLLMSPEDVIMNGSSKTMTQTAHLNRVQISSAHSCTFDI